MINFKSKKYFGNGDWGLGIGDWGLGIGPNPQSPLFIYLLINYIIIYIINKNKNTAVK